MTRRPMRGLAVAAGVLALGCAGDAAGPRPSPFPPGQFVVIVGDDWQSYTSTADLRANTGWRLGNGTSAANLVDLVNDPALGQVVRITQPANCSNPSALGSSPEHRHAFSGRDKVWYRWRMRFSPGWTTVGPTPAGAANSYKVAFITWIGRAERQYLEWSNQNHYLTGFSQPGMSYTETPLYPGTGWYNSTETTEWTGAAWWEYIMYYERLSPTAARARFWRRELTQSDTLVDNPFDIEGWEYAATSGTFAQAGGVALGVNKNKCNPSDQYIYWGPYEVVDGSIYSNPFGVGP